MNVVGVFDSEMQFGDAFDATEAQVWVQKCAAIENFGFLYDLTEDLIADISEGLQFIEVGQRIVFAGQGVAQVELVTAIVCSELNLVLMLRVDHHILISHVIEIEHRNAFVSEEGEKGLVNKTNLISFKNITKG